MMVLGTIDYINTRLYAISRLILIIIIYINTSTNQIYTLSLHDALPIYPLPAAPAPSPAAATERPARGTAPPTDRSEEHTSELQSHHDLVCRLLLEKKKKMSISKNIDLS